MKKFTNLIHSIVTVALICLVAFTFTMDASAKSSARGSTGGRTGARMSSSSRQRSGITRGSTTRLRVSPGRRARVSAHSVSARSRGSIGVGRSRGPGVTSARRPSSSNYARPSRDAGNRPGSTIRRQSGTGRQYGTKRDDGGRRDRHPGYGKNDGRRRDHRDGYRKDRHYRYGKNRPHYKYRHWYPDRYYRRYRPYYGLSFFFNYPYRYSWYDEPRVYEYHHYYKDSDRIVYGTEDGNGWVLLEDGDYSGALVVFKREMDRYPESGLPMIGYALSQCAVGNLSEGTRVMRRAVRKDHKAADYLLVDERLRPLFKNVIESYDNVLRRREHDEDAAFMLATLFYMSGDINNAYTMIDLAARNGDDSKSARNMRRLIDKSLTERVEI